MTKFTKQIFAATAAATMLLQVAVPAFATDTTGTGSVQLTVTGNGADSKNNENVNISNTTAVAQSNTAVVTNNINANSSTGGNEANKNTNGDVTVYSGDAASNVTVANDLNKNAATVGCCGSKDMTVKIDGNGADSYNKANLDVTNTNGVSQDNTAVVNNTVNANANTGKNDANKNTGGDVKIVSGDASTNVDVATHANVNWAQIGGNGGNGGSLSAIIIGNGADSKNKVDLGVDNTNAIYQDNTAVITNDVEANAKTGKNEANKNTGGDTTVVSGDANVTVGVDNTVNFNSADIDCGCLTDVMAKLAGNGAYSKNKIKADLNSTNSVDQGLSGGNTAVLNNDVNGNGKTGYNEANKNTGPAGVDPVLVWSGDGSSDVMVSNNGNVNVVGPLSLPDVEWNWDLSWFHFAFGH